MLHAAPSVNQSTYAPLDHLAALRAGDQEAWRQFAEWAWPLIRHDAAAHGLGDADVDNVSQDVLLAAFLHIKEFEPNSEPDCFVHWLRTTIRSKIVNRRRSRCPKLTDPKHLDELPDPWTIDPDGEEPGPADTARFEAMLERVGLEFPKPAWRAFLLITYEHRTAAEAGAEVGMSAAAVRTAKSRIIKRLVELRNG